MTATLKRRIESARRRRAAQWAHLWRIVGWLGVVMTLILSLMPPMLEEGVSHTDKLVHLAGYAMLTFWWAQLITRQRWKLAVAAVLFGIAIELLQGLTPNRQPDIFDALTNTGGVLLGWLAAHRLPNLPKRLAALSARQG